MHSKRLPALSHRFYKFLPDGKQADVESYLDFRKYLLEKGYSKETIYKYMLLLLPQGG